MRIVELHVEGFGRLRDRTIKPEGSLTVIYGPNEAGKSTLMNFIRSILFGFPSRANAPERYEPPGGGAHGGSLTLLTAAGQSLRVTRRAGAAAASRGRAPAAGRVTVMLEDGTVGGEELLLPHFGGIKGDQFRSLFAFSLDELQELRTLTGDELGSYLYSAGLGLRASAVLKAERRLAQEMDELYKPRGKNQEMNRLLKAIEELETDIRRSKAEIGRYDAITAELKALEDEIAGAEKELLERREELLFLEAAEQVRPHWLRREAVREELLNLSDAPSLAADAAGRHDALLAERERLLAELDGLAVQTASLEAALAAQPAPDQSLLKSRARLDELLEQLGSYRSAVRRAEELRAEAERIGEQLDALLPRIDPAWDVQTLGRHALSLHKREEAERFRERWKQSLGSLAALDEEVAARSRLEQEAYAREEALRSERERAEAAFDASFGRDLRLRPHSVPGELQELRRDLQQALRIKAELAHVENMRDTGGELPSRTAQFGRATTGGTAGSAVRLVGRLTWAAAGLTLLLPGLLMLSGQPYAAAGTAALLLAATGYLLAERRRMNRASGGKRLTSEAAAAGSAAPPNPAEQLGRELERLRTRIEGRLAALSLPLQAEAAAAEDGGNLSGKRPDWLDERFADAIEAEAGRLLEGLRELALCEERFQQAARQTEEARLLRRSAEERREREAERRQALAEQWRSWLQAFELSGSVSPDSAPELFRLLEQGQDLLRRKERGEAARHALLAEAAEYERQAALVLGDSALRDLPYALRQAKDSAAIAAERLADRQRTEEELRQLRERTELCSLALERLEGQLRELWREAGAADPHEFRSALERSERRRRLQDELQKLGALLEAGVGTARIGELDELLAAFGTHGLNRRIEERRLQTERLESRINELRDRKGRLGSERDKLELGEEHAERLQRLQEENAKLAALAARWAALAFCAGLFRGARRTYERERQPGVLKQASAYFAAMTGGRYSRIIVPVGEKRLLAELAETGERIDSTQLSRGTAEQLYLAMRFALADEFAKRAVLPVIMDDIFVNFDGERLQRALEVLGTFSQRRQVLLLTCHAHIAEGCRQSVPDSRIVTF